MIVMFLRNYGDKFSGIKQAKRNPYLRKLIIKMTWIKFEIKMNNQASVYDSIHEQ